MHVYFELAIGALRMIKQICIQVLYFHQDIFCLFILCLLL